MFLFLIKDFIFLIWDDKKIKAITTKQSTHRL